MSAYAGPVEDVGLSGQFDGLSVCDTGCEDGVLLHSYVPNSDGSITAWGTIYFHGPSGTPARFETDIKVRLKAEDVESRAWARELRRKVLQSREGGST